MTNGHAAKVAMDYMHRQVQKAITKAGPTVAHQDLASNLMHAVVNMDQVPISSGQNPDGTFQYLPGYDGPVTTS